MYEVLLRSFDKSEYWSAPPYLPGLAFSACPTAPASGREESGFHEE